MNTLEIMGKKSYILFNIRLKITENKPDCYSSKNHVIYFIKGNLAMMLELIYVIICILPF